MKSISKSQITYFLKSLPLHTPFTAPKVLQSHFTADRKLLQGPFTAPKLPETLFTAPKTAADSFHWTPLLPHRNSRRPSSLHPKLLQTLFTEHPFYCTETPGDPHYCTRNCCRLLLHSGQSRISFLPERSSIFQYPPKISATNIKKQSRARLLLTHPVLYILKIRKTYGTFWKPPFQNQPKSVRL